MNQVFVYGTLKRHQVNHPLLEGVGIKRIRYARLCGVELFDITDPVRPYPYPALLRGQGQLLGELVELGTGQHPDDALLVLDHLEMAGFEYQRVKCWVRVRNRLERAWVYLYASKAHLYRSQGIRRYALTWSPRRYQHRQ